MTQYDRHYSGSPREMDDTAIADMREYLEPQQWNALVKLASLPETTINHVNFAMAFAGVSGRPFHAFCRRYMLERYREWMASEPDPIETDDEGHRLETANAG